MRKPRVRNMLSHETLVHTKAEHLDLASFDSFECNYVESGVKRLAPDVSS